MRKETHKPPLAGIEIKKSMRNLLVSLSSDSDAGIIPSDHRKIPFSDVVVSNTRSLFWGRQWRTIDIQVAIWVSTVHLLSLFAPFTFSWDAFFLAFSGYLLTGLLGVTLAYHRLLAHHSLKLPKWLEYTCVYFGRDPIFWVSMHRYHHQYVDSNKDTHSPISGFWFSHMGWLFDSGYILEKYQERKNVEDLKKQPFYMFIRKTYMWHILGLAALLYAVGGFPYLVWGVSWNTGDLSKNNWWVAVLTFGEGWHNNHHAFEYSARHGLEWWQVDISWYIIRFLESVGLATNVKLPTEAHKLKRSLNNSADTFK
ncbi:hypothetical protein Ccrd_015623 [Cynara cardunculus var. scolymus]|uniref:Fatty acid desaturase, type 1 n=1 Tax=Cynara cardunculus var. scolymus TaxID=59895 RepID=A0A103YBH7_CYNCS|nr:hypothetical protein Ccrd_015623 [Cynara cardunculus var. scolymus]